MYYIAMLTLGVFLLDQLSKLWIVHHMALYESWTIIPGVFHITYILNPGAAFGILRQQQGFFLAIVCILSACAVYFRKRLEGFSRWGQTGVALLLGGAFGNAYDRLTQAAVIDFFDFRLWPIFNVADIAITCGVAIVIVYLWREDARKG